MGADKGCVQYAEGMYVPGLDAVPQLAEDSVGFVGSSFALVVPFEVVGDVDSKVSFKGSTEEGDKRAWVNYYNLI